MKYTKRTWKQDLKRNWPLYMIFLIPAAYFIIFKYIPMVGILMAFEDYKPAKGLLGSTWVGMQNFVELFTGDQFPLAIRNTCAMALLNLTFGFAAPVLLGLLISQLRSPKASRAVQTVTYMPYFVSAVVCCALAQEFLNDTGAITQMLSVFGFDKQNWLAVNSPVFWIINCCLGIWQGAGYGAIIYIASIANISHELYEAAAIDGASRLQRAWHVTLPGIMPAIVTMLVLKCGMLLQVGGDKILLLYNPSIYSTADVISTHVQRMGIEQMNYGYSTAVGLFNSIVGTILLVGSNAVSAKLTDTSVV